MPEGLRPVLAPLDEEVDHARGPTAGRVILEYGDYECPYSRQAFRAIEHVEQELKRAHSFHVPALPALPNPPARVRSSGRRRSSRSAGPLDEDDLRHASGFCAA
jgi:hypothetical protein